MHSASVTCPACKARVALKIGDGETIVHCPECHKAFKIKGPATDTAKANSAPDPRPAQAARGSSLPRESPALAPLSPLTAEDEFPLAGGSLTPLDSLDTPELASLPSADDEYRLADEPLASLSDFLHDDLDAIAPLAPLAPVASTPLATPRRGARRLSRVLRDL